MLLTVLGVLKGYDQLLNLVLDETTEFLRGGSFSPAISRAVVEFGCT